MNIREMLEREKYINKTIDSFSKKVRDSESCIRFGITNTIGITVDDARQIANCLEWLQEIFETNINNINITDVNINQLSGIKYT